MKSFPISTIQNELFQIKTRTLKPGELSSSITVAVVILHNDQHNHCRALCNDSKRFDESEMQYA